MASTELAPGLQHPSRIIVAEPTRRKEPSGNGAAFIEHREKHEALFAKAFAAAQGEFTEIKRTREVTVTPRDPSKRAYTFCYAPLDIVLAAVMPALNKHGFSLTQRITEDKLWVVTTLLHEHGSRENYQPIFFQDLTSQAYSSSTSYARRYGVTLLLCLASEDDDDGNIGEGNNFDQRPPAEQRAAAKRGKSTTQVLPAPAKSGPTVKVPQALQAHAPPGQPDPYTLQAPRAPWAQNPYEPPADPKEQALVEGIIADAIQDLHEAALEGRRVTIEQVWEELGDNHYAKQEVWTRLKRKHADSFATVRAILHPEQDPAGRGQAAKAKKASQSKPTDGGQK